MVYLGELWEVTREYQKAESVYKKMLAEYPHSRWRPDAEADLRFVQKKARSGGIQWTKDPVAKQYVSAARLWTKRGELLAAAQRFEAIARANPKHELAPMALLSAGYCYFLAGRLGAAQVRWHEVLERYPHSSCKADADFALRAAKDPKLRESLRWALTGD
jgi:outer membrane protein assembly factor BamD (BamD/ComL family)